MQQGWHIAYSDEAEIIHIHNESLERTYNRYRREAIAFKRIFPEERFGLWDFIRLYVLNVINDLIHSRYSGKGWAAPAQILAFRLMQLWGTCRGFAWHKPLTSDLKRRMFYPSRYLWKRPLGESSSRSQSDLVRLE